MKIHEQITEESWSQLGSWPENGKWCIEGWIDKIYPTVSVEERFGMILKCMMAAPCLLLTQWNDEDGTRTIPDTKTGMGGATIPVREFKDVVRVFKKADI